MSQVTLYSAYSDNRLNEAGVNKARLCMVGTIFGAILMAAGLGLWLYAMTHLNLSDRTFTILVTSLAYLGLPGAGIFAIAIEGLNKPLSNNEIAEYATQSTHQAKDTSDYQHEVL